MENDSWPSRVGAAGFTVLICILAFAFLYEWHATRTAAGKMSHDVKAILKNLRVQQESILTGLDALPKGIKVAHEALLAKIESRLRSREAALESHAPAPQETDEAVGDLPDAAEDAGQLVLRFGDLDGLPDLPEGLKPASALEDKRLPELVQEYRMGPNRRLDAMETAEALNILAEARAAREVLRSRRRLETLKAVAILRDRGEFVDFARGEPYYQEEGVVSFGEDLGDRGMRIFYLFREEFPEVYSLAKESDRVAEVAAREVLALIRGEGD